MNANKIVEGGFQPSMTLPSGWEVSSDEDGNVFYIDHNTKTTQWEPPGTKPPDQFPNMGSAGLSDRHDSSREDEASESFELEKLRLSQARMIWKYLLAVQSDFKSKGEITETLRSRLELANVQSQSFKQVMKSASGVAKSNPLQCRNKSYDISALTKQYLESQKRVQHLQKDLSARGFSYNFSDSCNSIWHLLEDKPGNLLGSSQGNLKEENGQGDTPLAIRKQLAEVMAAIENVRIQLVPLQPEFDHGRLSVIQEKEVLMQELLNWHRDLIYEKSKTEKTSLDEVEERIYNLREELSVNKQRCNFVSNRRLSLLERQEKLETRYTNLLLKLQESCVEFNGFDCEHRIQLSNWKNTKEHRSSTYPVESVGRSPRAFIESCRNWQQLVDCDYRFLSDVNQLDETNKVAQKSMGFLMPYQNENTCASNQAIHNPVSREKLEAYVNVSNSSENNAKELCCYQTTDYTYSGNVEKESGGLYENLSYTSRFLNMRSNEEHDRMTLISVQLSNDASYDNADWNRMLELPTFYHRSEDSGVAFYENISAARKNRPISTSPHEQIVDEHSETCFTCQVLIDIKFTINNQLHVRLEEMKDVEMPAGLENIQFSVEILSMHYPHSFAGGCSSCHCSRQFSAKELDSGGNLIINEFIVFDLPRKELTSKILRIILFCGSTSTCASFENFLVERNLNLIQVYKNQNTTDTSSYWYSFTAFENIGRDSRFSQSKATFNCSSNVDVHEHYDKLMLPKIIPTKSSSVQCNKKVQLLDNFAKPDFCKQCVTTYVTSSQAMYTVKNAAIANLQVLKEATFLNPSELKSFGVEGSHEQQLVNSDEGYDERPIDCEGLTDSSLECQNSSEVGGLKRSQNVGQMRPYASFNHQISKKSQYAPKKLSRSESDGATQQYLVKPHALVGESGIFGVGGGNPSFGLSNIFKRNAVERIPSRAKNKNSPQRCNPSPNIESSSPSTICGSSLSSSPSIVTNFTTFHKK